MKILHITPEAPGYTSGGRLGILQTELSITSPENIVDYVGPEIEDPSLRQRYRHCYVPTKTGNPVVLLYDAARGITNKSYESWKRLPIDYASYDAVVLDFTKQSYVLQKVDPKKLIVRVHNVEYDFSRSAYELNKTLKNRIVMKASYRQESTLLNAAARVVPLTEQDIRRLDHLYHVDKSKIHLVPVCTRSRDTGRQELEADGNSMIITGSLWFGGNYDGIKWFLDHVFTKLTTQPKLIIAGKNPNDELKKAVKAYGDRIQLIDSPKDMAPYFRKAVLSIAPVFDGAGMKVKVAEALSYGLPVVGTKHAMTGYCITNGVDSYKADSPEEFIRDIDGYFSKTKAERVQMREKALELFNTSYSMDSSVKEWKAILSEFV